MNKMRRIYVIFIFALTFSLIGCGAKKDKEEPEKNPVKLETSQMQTVCELATLECYYHNTAKLNSEKKVLFWNTSKRLWIEYSGIVKVGIDLSKFDMSVEDNVVTIAIPDAKILGCEVDDASLSADTFYSETKGLGSGKVGANDQTKAFQAAQEGMLAAVQEDESLLLQAKVRAQTLLENYVKNIGDAIGIDYEIRWENVEEDEGTLGGLSNND